MAKLSMKEVRARARAAAAAARRRLSPDTCPPWLVLVLACRAPTAHSSHTSAAALTIEPAAHLMARANVPGAALQ